MWSEYYTMTGCEIQSFHHWHLYSALAQMMYIMQTPIHCLTLYW